MPREVHLPPVEKLGTDLDPALQPLFFDRSPAAIQSWCETFLTIPDLQQQIVPVRLFPQQIRMLEDHTGRDIYVKGRQSRTSSLELMVTVLELTTTWGYTAITGVHNDPDTQAFRHRIKHHLRDLAAHGLEYTLSVDNDDELAIAGLESRIIFQSGEKRIIGRSRTAHRVHFSEVAHWRAETVGPLMGGLKPSVPGPPFGSIVLESTPNGAEGYFYGEILDARPGNPEGLWTVQLYPWWMEPRYRVGSEPGVDIMLPAYELQEKLANFRPTPEEERLMQKADLTPDRILWRRLKIADLAKTTTPFFQEFPETLEGCFLSISGNYFQTPDGIDHLEWYRNLITPPVMEHDVLPYSKSPVRFGEARLAVWEFPDPTQVYVVYVDCASGEQGASADFTAINVLNAGTMHKAARFRAKVTPNDAAAIACAIGEYYGNALLGVERIGHGSACLDRVRELLYPNIYYHYDPMQPKKEAKPGIYPTPQMREKLLQGYRVAVVNHTYVTRDALEVQEMGTFDWTKAQNRMKVQAAGTQAHDDIIMSGAGCLLMAPEAKVRRKPGPREDEDDVILVGRYGNIINPMRQNKNGPQFWMR